MKKLTKQLIAFIVVFSFSIAAVFCCCLMETAQAAFIVQPEQPSQSDMSCCSSNTTKNAGSSSRRNQQCRCVKTIEAFPASQSSFFQSPELINQSFLKDLILGDALFQTYYGQLGMLDDHSLSPPYRITTPIYIKNSILRI